MLIEDFNLCLKLLYISFYLLLFSFLSFEDVKRNSLAGSQTDLVLLDFSKAFDKVSHQKLLLKLHQHGIRGPSLKWIQAFLSGRTQTVVLENGKSGTVPVTSGVPQGSVLGPILFLIYINDLPDKTRSKIRLFADDMAIYLAVSNLQDAQILQHDLDHLHEWELQWDMEFNPSKCVVIHVTRARTPVPSEYLLHGHILESVGGSKYLGVEISDNLSFNNHIQKIYTTASRSLGFIKRNIRTKCLAIREMAYKTGAPISRILFICLEPHTPKTTSIKMKWSTVGRLGGHLTTLQDRRVYQKC